VEVGVVEEEIVVVGKNSDIFEGVVVVVGDVLEANTSDVVMVEAVAEATFVGVVGTAVTGRCIRSPLLGAGIAFQLM
jgi:pyruvate/2-oxoglutarate/acetoin dehydrogenase E1 component